MELELYYFQGVPFVFQYSKLSKAPSILRYLKILLATILKWRANYRKIAIEGDYAMGTNPSVVKFEASISGELHKLLERAAQFRGLSMADFVFDAAREAAEEALDTPELCDLKAQETRLSLEDQNFVADLILNPPSMSPVLEGTIRRHPELVQSDCWD